MTYFTFKVMKDRNQKITSINIYISLWLIRRKNLKLDSYVNKNINEHNHLSSLRAESNRRLNDKASDYYEWHTVHH